MAVRITPFTIISHVVFVDEKNVFGPGHAVDEFLSKKNINHVYIKHSLYDSRKSELKKGNKTYKLKYSGIFPAPIKYFQEILASLIFLRKKPTKVIIAANPLNAITGIIAKQLGYAKHTIFYTVDYAEKRFSNHFLNFMYHSIDTFARHNSDKVWNVSTRIQQIRTKQGIKEDCNRLVPNTPILASLSKFKQSKQHPISMVLMANFTPAIDYDSILKSAKLLSQKWKNFKLTFIGSGEREEEIKKKAKNLKIEKNVEFKGFLPHKKALKEAAKSKIGLAPYKKAWPWTEYGDSLKAREYLALGLPVIISNIVSTSDDISNFNAGKSIKISSTSLSDSVSDILTNYKIYKKNAYKLAKKYDLEKILTTELKSYTNKLN